MKPVRGTDSPWKALFEKLPEHSVSVSVHVSRSPTTYVWTDGVFESTAHWDNYEETVELHGVILSSSEGVQSWIPYDVIGAVALT